MKTFCTILLLLSSHVFLIGQDLYSQTEIVLYSDSTVALNLESSQSYITEPAVEKDAQLPPPRMIKQTYMDLDGNIPPLQKRVNDFLSTLKDSKSAVIHFMAIPRENPGGPHIVFSVLIEYYVSVP